MKFKDASKEKQINFIKNNAEAEYEVANRIIRGNSFEYNDMLTEFRESTNFPLIEENSQGVYFDSAWDTYGLEPKKIKDAYQKLRSYDGFIENEELDLRKKFDELMQKIIKTNLKYFYKNKFTYYGVLDGVEDYVLQYPEDFEFSHKEI